MPRPGKPAARTTLPHPPRTSQNVPRNSLDSFGNTSMSSYAHHPPPTTYHLPPTTHHLVHREGDVHQPPLALNLQRHRGPGFVPAHGLSELIEREHVGAVHAADDVTRQQRHFGPGARRPRGHHDAEGIPEPAVRGEQSLIDLHAEDAEFEDEILLRVGQR